LAIRNVKQEKSFQGEETMKKKIAFFLVVFLLSLTACGAADKSSSYGDSPVVYRLIAPSEIAAGEEYLPEAVVQESVAPVGLDTEISQVLQKRMVIMNADLTIVIRDPQAKMEEIAALAKSLGGFVISMEIYQTSLDTGGTTPEGHISIRVPADQLDAALDQIKAGVVKVDSESRSGQDITSSYVDLQSRLSALEAARDQLQTIMDNATKTEDVLNVFSQLQYYNEQIESVKGQMQYYEEATAYSLINVTLIAEETIQPLQIGPWTPKGAAQDAYKALIDFLRGFVEFLIWFFILVIPVLIVTVGPVALIVWLIVRTVKRSKARKQPKQ